MNIIEDIRDALLHAVENRSAPPRTPMDLWTVLKDEWDRASPAKPNFIENPPCTRACYTLNPSGPNNYKYKPTPVQPTQKGLRPRKDLRGIGFKRLYPLVGRGRRISSSSFD
ncbi:hypothetical protein AVEN_91216-1 [Araneus ventricosus]|uniref:Uncharacterized protein n=1 Tax=Araneus ventricosus TaxID=182803 RepID=A0A4Y2KEE7_ARAVE|nr:hypothetical protein AVEN_91216-1 [Araneus ventricosus]